MNLRRAFGWFYRRLVASAEAGRLRVLVAGRMVEAVDGDDVDAWLLGLTPPSLIRLREEAPVVYAAAGVELG